MKKIFFFASIIIWIASCKIQPDSERRYDELNGRVYKLHISPDTNTIYHYNISNETSFTLEVDEKKTTNLSKTNVEVNYEIKKDSSGNFLLKINYDKIHLYTKTGDVVSDMDANDTFAPTDLVQKVLNVVKNSNLTAVVNPGGELKKIYGLKEMSDKIIAEFSANNVQEKTAAQKKVNEMIGQGVVKKNIEQLFTIFPDSAIHVGDRWKLSSNEKDEINFKVESFYTLKEITDNTATITMNGELTSDSSANLIMGYEVNANLKGKEEGEFEINFKTGMLIQSNITASIEGTLEMEGREIPMTIEKKIKMNEIK